MKRPLGAVSAAAAWLRRGVSVMGWGVARLAEGPVKEMCSAYFGLAARLAQRGAPRPASAGGLGVAIIVQEYFASTLGGVGGFGMTTRLLVEHLRNAPEGYRPIVILPQDLGLVQRPELREVDGTPVLLLPSLPRLLRHPIRLARLLDGLQPGFLVTIDYLTKYEYPLWAAPHAPLLVYLGDPRGPREWRRIASVALEGEAHHRPGRLGLVDIARQHRASLARVRRWSRWRQRPIAYATDCHDLVARAREKFGLPHLEAHYLPPPLNLPEPVAPTFAERPMLLFLGRVEPQKRPWMVYELAKRLPDVEFVLAGPSQRAELMEPVLARRGHPANLRRTGPVFGEAKDALFRQCWALLNTSIHEGLPVTFLEAFTFAKCPISSVDPDGLVTRFGYSAGDVLGDGDDPAALDAYERAIRSCLADEQGRRERGLAAQRFVHETMRPEDFLAALRQLLEQQGWFGSAAAVGSGEPAAGPHPAR